MSTRLSSTVRTERGSRGGPLSHPPFGALIAVALVLIATGAGVLFSTGTPVAHSAHVAPASAVSLAPRLGHLGLVHQSLPLGSDTWYTQEGMTLSQVDGSSANSPKVLKEDLTLVTSPYSDGYELNGLSNTGDWYQIVVADNWPGCNAGFEEVIEVWDSTGASGPVSCDPTLSLSAGDHVELQLGFSSSSQACLTMVDVSAGTNHQVCQAQPDTGASNFLLLGSNSNANGYYSGPMTETVNLVAASCPDYTNLPTLSYVYPTPTYITAYVPWSDEWDFGGSGTFCYSGGGSEITVLGGDPTSHYVDTASGTLYGPHWGEGQNATYLSASEAFLYQTDPVPLTGVSMSASPTLLTLGASANYSVTGTGGVAPYRAILAVNGTPGPVVPSTGSFTPPGAGRYALSGFVVDSQNNVFGPSTPVTIDVPGILSVGPVRSTPRMGSADVNFPVTLQASVTGGIPPRTYVWSGLPPGCTSANSASLVCQPTSVGSYTVGLTVNDSNGSVVVAPALSLTVLPDPTATLTPSTTVLDLGQALTVSASAAGGSGGFSYLWSGLPTGCAAGNVSVWSCTPTGTGNFSVEFNATDTNGFPAHPAHALQVVVHPALVVRLVGSRAVADIGETDLLTGTAIGGTPAFHYSWNGLPPGCATADLATLACAPTQTGVYTISLTATDAANVTVVARSVSLLVYSPLVVSLTATPNPVLLGYTLTISAAVGGGSSNPQISWSNLPPGCGSAASGLSVTCAPSTVGVYNVTIHLSDSSGARANATVAVGVTNPPVSQNPILGGLSPLELAGIAIAALVVVGIGIGLAVRSRRARRP